MPCALDWEKIVSPLSNFKWVLTPNFWATCFKILGGYRWRIQDFPKVGAPTPQVDVKSYYLAIFSQILHETERILTPKRARIPGAPPPLGSANRLPSMNCGTSLEVKRIRPDFHESALLCWSGYD